ncbi:MAG: glycerol-3-phosphate responsive antiterminator [Anaerococcus hydrogenalis]|nr:glycerol-3-phosphate responsive antiterminator [Anaerococcus hydrogenalis]
MVDLMDILFENPCIMAIKDNTDLKECLKDEHENNKVVFVLYGSIETIPTIVEKLKDRDKVVFVHEDLIEGLSSSSLSSSFIKKFFIIIIYQKIHKCRWNYYNKKSKCCLCKKNRTFIYIKIFCT